MERRRLPGDFRAHCIPVYRAAGLPSRSRSEARQEQAGQVVDPPGREPRLPTLRANATRFRGPVDLADTSDGMRFNARRLIRKSISPSVALALVVGVALFGCKGDESEDPLFVSGQEMMKARWESRRDKHEGVQVLRLRVAAVDVPIGLSSASEDVWSAVDEDVVSPVRSINFTANGLRVGVGSPEQWDRLVGALGKLAGQPVRQSITVGALSQPITVALKERQGPRTLFIVYRDGTLSGRDIPAGDYLLAILYATKPGQPDQLTITGQPQIRSQRRHARISNVEGRTSVTRRPTLTGLESMTFQLTIPTGSFILIGPSGRASEPNTVGHQFLVKTKGGLPVETLLILIPEIVET